MKFTLNYLMIKRLGELCSLEYNDISPMNELAPDTEELIEEYVDYLLYAESEASDPEGCEGCNYEDDVENCAFEAEVLRAVVRLSPGKWFLQHFSITSLSAPFPKKW